MAVFLCPCPPARPASPRLVVAPASARETVPDRFPLVSVAVRRCSLPASAYAPGRTAPRARRTARHHSSCLSPQSPGPTDEQRHERHHCYHRHQGVPVLRRDDQGPGQEVQALRRVVAWGRAGGPCRPRISYPPRRHAAAALAPPRTGTGARSPVRPGGQEPGGLGGGRERSRALPPAGDRAPVRGERLASSADGDGYHCRHRDYFLALAEEAKEALGGLEQAHWLDVLESEHDNLRRAITFCLEEEARGELVEGEKGLRLGWALQRFWGTRGYLGEGASVWRLCCRFLWHRRAPGRVRVRCSGRGTSPSLRVTLPRPVPCSRRAWP
jgi:hypothetical protein